MSDDHERLRRTMSELAEHGGHTDLYERTLRRSRRVQRRRTVAASAATAVAVLAVGGGVAFTAAHRAGPPVPVATRPVGTVPATPSATVPTSAAPTSAAPTSATPATTAPSSAPATSRSPRYPGCPSAKTLESLADLPDGWRFVPSSVTCWRTWATADPEGPTPGDGIYLFQYRSGSWRLHSEGSGYVCADLGITSGDPPFCQMD